MTHSSFRINELSARLNSKSYLEIGVYEGETFRLIEIGEKIGVDPKFRFDINDIAYSGAILIEKTSDEYFSSLPLYNKFDIIFIDGSHDFKQVLKDFSNAIMHTHDNSIIILDDTVPSDIFSSFPDPQDTSDLRLKFGSTSHDWHGDVFKAVFYINDFWPSLNYRTISTRGNPQTLIWRDKFENYAPRFGNLESISRMSYLEFYKNSDVLRFSTEEQAIDICVAAIKSRK